MGNLYIKRYLEKGPNGEMPENGIQWVPPLENHTYIFGPDTKKGICTVGDTKRYNIPSQGRAEASSS
jgi:hypothetical protein